MVNIYFNAGSFDKVTRSAKTNFVSQLSLIGGTFGLFTGFSILSGIEIIYFFIKVDCLFQQSKGDNAGGCCKIYSKVVTTVLDKMTTGKKEKKPEKQDENTSDMDVDQSEAFDILFKKEAGQVIIQSMYGDIKTT